MRHAFETAPHSNSQSRDVVIQQPSMLKASSVACVTFAAQCVTIRWLKAQQAPLWYGTLSPSLSQQRLVIGKTKNRLVRFIGRAHKARWYVDLGVNGEWDMLMIAFSRRDRVESPQNPWPTERYNRVGPVHCMLDELARAWQRDTYWGAAESFRGPTSRSCASGIRSHIQFRCH